ncbi:hypothetical protein UY3_09863 [Chelonia mydas]|uniref:Uncharacterized protein n=1 Tax=Chelonia mydas TaxID=8469 RepID=M7BBP4_CHEMY|nr:hypothetical protein UY3_09863 [Chelonia mydas]
MEESQCCANDSGTIRGTAVKSGLYGNSSTIALSAIDLTRDPSHESVLLQEGQALLTLVAQTEEVGEEEEEKMQNGKDRELSGQRAAAVGRVPRFEGSALSAAGQK